LSNSQRGFNTKTEDLVTFSCQAITNLLCVDQEFLPDTLLDKLGQLLLDMQAKKARQVLC